MTVLCMYSRQWSLSTRDKYDGSSLVERLSSSCLQLVLCSEAVFVKVLCEHQCSSDAELKPSYKYIYIRMYAHPLTEIWQKIEFKAKTTGRLCFQGFQCMAGAIECRTEMQHPFTEIAL